MNYEEQQYKELRDETIREAQTKRRTLFFETAASGCGYYVFPCGCCRSNCLASNHTDPVETTCAKHLGAYEATPTLAEVVETDMMGLLKSKLHEYVLEKVKNDEIVFKTRQGQLTPNKHMEVVDTEYGYGLHHSDIEGLTYGGVKLDYPLADEIMRIALHKERERWVAEEKMHQFSKLTKIALKLGFIS